MYFNTDKLGRLILVDELIFYDELVLFTARDDNGCTWFVQLLKFGYKEYLAMRISEQRMKLMDDKRISIYDAFKNAETNVVYRLVLDDSDNKYIVTEIPAALIDDRDLPDKNIFL